MKCKVNGINLYYEEIGAGEVILFLHGNCQDGTMFAKTVKYFADNRCILLDSRAHGKSEWGKDKLTIPLFADDVVKFIEALKLNNVTLVGFSDGGNIALEVAAVSNKIKNVVAVGANLYPKGLTNLTRSMVNLTRALFLPLSFIPSFARVRKRYYLMSHQPEITADKLSKIAAQALIVAGTHDMIKTSHTQEIHAKIPHSKIALFEKADHFLFEKRLPELAKLIQEFLSQTNFI